MYRSDLRPPSRLSAPVWTIQGLVACSIFSEDSRERRSRAEPGQRLVCLIRSRWFGGRQPARPAIDPVVGHRRGPRVPRRERPHCARAARLFDYFRVHRSTEACAPWVSVGGASPSLTRGCWSLLCTAMRRSGVFAGIERRQVRTRYNVANVPSLGGPLCATFVSIARGAPVCSPDGCGHRIVGFAGMLHRMHRRACLRHSDDPPCKRLLGVCTRSWLVIGRRLRSVGDFSSSSTETR